MGGGGAHHGEAASHVDFRTKVWSMPGGPYCRPVHWKRNTAVAMFGIFLVCIPIAMKSAELESSLGKSSATLFLRIFLNRLEFSVLTETMPTWEQLVVDAIWFQSLASLDGVCHQTASEESCINNRLALVRKIGKCTLGYNIVRGTLRSFISYKGPPLRKSDIECCSMVAKQRPHMPVRPIPSQMWCKNFGENSKKDY
ncbi:hypothetical protein C5167_004785 [Papaver somniferum]|uniref:Uncharacterized protein n=1 Tax=Papaver somniferum TaxID=3469 RepID=A0A4Y7J8L2_PAPSO|nr:hypothetical protein C5167_004785 [Papaver somniferum]